MWTFAIVEGEVALESSLQIGHGGVVAFQRVGQKNTAAGQVLSVLPLDDQQMFLRWGAQTFGQHRNAVVRTLTITRGNLTHRKIHVFRPQKQTFHQSQTTAI